MTSSISALPGTQTIPARPVAKKRRSKRADRQLIIKNIPLPKTRNLDQTILERTLNHVKDTYVRGEYEDVKLKAACGKRRFRFCMTYTFQHDGDSTLIINFHISYTGNAPKWVNDTETQHSLTSMSKNEVNLIADAYIRQCLQALRSYVTLVYNLAAQKGTEPDYYSTQLPA